MTAHTPYTSATAPRWWDFVKAGRLFCPAQHHMPNTFDVTEAGFTQCREWVHDSHRRHECGLWLFLFAIRGGGIVAAAVSPEEKRAMKDLSTPAEMIEYLGIFTRGPRSSPSSSFPPDSASGSTTSRSNRPR